MSGATAVYLVRDLLFVSKIAEAADHFHVAIQSVRDADQPPPWRRARSSSSTSVIPGVRGLELLARAPGGPRGRVDRLRRAPRSTS
jgi:hypothetical protein